MQLAARPAARYGSLVETQRVQLLVVDDAVMDSGERCEGARSGWTQVVSFFGTFCVHPARMRDPGARDRCVGDESAMGGEEGAEEER